MKLLDIMNPFIKCSLCTGDRPVSTKGLLIALAEVSGLSQGADGRAVYWAGELWKITFEAMLAEVTSSVLVCSWRSIKHPFVGLTNFLMSTQLREPFNGDRDMFLRLSCL